MVMRARSESPLHQGLRGRKTVEGTQHRVRRALLAFVTTLAIGALLWFINVLRTDVVTALVLALAVGAVITLLTWVMSEESPRLSRAHWFASMREESVRPGALDYRMLRLRRDLRDATERNDRTDEIFPVIHELVAERLRSKHGLDLVADRDEVQALLHPDLAKYLSDPPTGTAKRSKRQLARALDRIEEL